MSQLNTPYPATCYITGFLRSWGYDCHQRDASIDLFHNLFSPEGLEQIHTILQSRKDLSPAAFHFVAHFQSYRQTIEPVKRFLQGLDSAVAWRIVGRQYLPEGPAFAALEQWRQLDDENLEWAFGNLGIHDKAKHLATLYINDLAATVKEVRVMRKRPPHRRVQQGAALVAITRTTKKRNTF